MSRFTPVHFDWASIDWWGKGSIYWAADIDWGRLAMGDLPTWLAAIGTVAAVSVALWQVRADQFRRRQQEHRAQAGLIAVWYSGDKEGMRSVLSLLNDSSQPVYEAVATLTRSGGPGERVPLDYRAVLPTLPPGRWKVEVSGDWHGMSAYATAEVAFTDHRGDTHWIRRSNGKLEEIQRSAIEHYDIGRPFGSAALQADANGEP